MEVKGWVSSVWVWIRGCSRLRPGSKPGIGSGQPNFARAARVTRAAWVAFGSTQLPIHFFDSQARRGAARLLSREGLEASKPETSHSSWSPIVASSVRVLKRRETLQVVAAIDCGSMDLTRRGRSGHIVE